MPAKKLNKYFKSNSDKDRVVACYASTGSFSKTSSITGVAENTIRYWSKQDWFSEALRRADQADSEEIKSTLTRIAKKSTDELEDRLQNGDEVFDKEGNIVRKKVGGKDLAVITGITVQRRKELMDVPVMVSNQSSTEKLLSLMQQFIRFSQAKDINAKDFRTISEPIAIEGSVEEVSLRDSDEPTSEGGGPEEGDSSTDIEGNYSREHDPRSTGQGSSGEVLEDTSQTLRIQV